jgi:hypothetical protein
MKALFKLLFASLPIVIFFLPAHRTVLSTGREPSGVVHAGESDHYLVGLIGEHELRLEELCPQGVSSVRIWQGPTDKLVTAVTIGIYSPREFAVACAK